MVQLTDDKLRTACRAVRVERTARKGLVVRGLGHSGWQIRDLAGRSLEERIKGSEAGV